MSRTRCGRGRRKRERHTDFGTCIPQREPEIVVQMSLCAIAHAELDAEVDTESDEQHRERHGNEVERAEHQQTERRGHRHADEQAE